jgi:hypothetical protein
MELVFLLTVIGQDLFSFFVVYQVKGGVSFAQDSGGSDRLFFI